MSFFFFFNDTATTEIYTLSLHDALPIYFPDGELRGQISLAAADAGSDGSSPLPAGIPDLTSEVSSPDRDTRKPRSEEHTSELQSRQYLVCRLLLEKKKTSKR